MNSQASATLRGPETDFFSAPTYSAWVRGTIRAAADRKNPVILFGSSISEPTDELVRMVREAFSAKLTSRYISVFSDGNRYVANAICARYGVRPDSVIMTTGVTSVLAMTIKALAKPGDRVLIEQPGFDLLGSIAREAGAVVDSLARPAPRFLVDQGELETKLTPNTRVVVVTNLHNPSGAYLTNDDIKALAATTARFGAVLLVDEVYADFARPAYGAPAGTLGPNIISANSLTKVFGLHALKCGWMVGPSQLLNRIQSFSSDGDVGISKLSHAVAAHVLESADDFDKRWRDILNANRPVLQRHVEGMRADGLLEGEIPEFGCMYFPKVVGAFDTLTLSRTLWERFGILVAPGEYFGMPGHIRIGFGEDTKGLDDGLALLARALKALRAA